MKIDIENFANIKKANITIEENKLNFIYGISGSGKTSLAKALTINKEDDYQKHKTFGCEGVAKIEVENNTEFKIFNDASIEEYIFTKSGIGIYDVIYGENDELIALKKELNDFLSQKELQDVRNIVSNQSFIIDNLEKELGLSRTTTGAPSKKGLFKSLSTATKYYNANPDIDVKTKDWIKSGYSLIQNDTCPFCNQEMASNIVEKIRQIVNELPSEYSRVIESEKALKSLGISVDVSKINEEVTQQALFKDIGFQYQLLTEMKQIGNALSVSIHDDSALAKKVNIKKPSEDVIKIFNDSGIDILELITQLKKDTEGYTLLKKQYNGKLQSLIKKNIKKINEDILFFGIHYKFSKSNILSKNDSYQLIHKKADEDTSNFLSTGEKNIVALILFLTAYPDMNLIVDDPASSFDEYRREQILTYIFNKRYLTKPSNITTLILSHDQIFLKFLTKNYMSDNNYKDCIGNIFHFENIGGESHVVPIEKYDMLPISLHIKNRLASASTYTEKIINLRLFFEVNNSKSIEYSYLSAILHSIKDNLSSKDLEDKLNKKSTNEESILESINKKTSIHLEKFSPNKIDLSLDGLSNFEKICCVRELLNDSSSEKKELNNVIHFNYALNHILNPYKFNFQSEKSYQIIATHFNGS